MLSLWTARRVRKLFLDAPGSFSNADPSLPRDSFSNFGASLPAASHTPLATFSQPFLQPALRLAPAFSLSGSVGPRLAPRTPPQPESAPILPRPLRCISSAALPVSVRLSRTGVLGALILPTEASEVNFITIFNFQIRKQRHRSVK